MGISRASQQARQANILISMAGGCGIEPLAPFMLCELTKKFDFLSQLLEAGRKIR